MIGPRRILFAGGISFVLGGIALAADVPLRTPAPYVAKAPIALSPWEGPYIGIHGGYGWLSSDVNPLGIGNFPHDGDNAFGGFQLGYNHHLSPNWVLGFEADFSFGRLRADGAVGPFPSTLDIDAFGTVRSRLGYAAGPYLAYVTGGVAWASTSYNLPAGPLSFDRAHVGWTIGAGVEYAISRNFSAKAEYLYADLGDTDGLITSTSSVNLHMVRLGLNYRFGDIAYATAPANYPTKAPVRAFTWSGAYVGVHGGYSWSNHEIDFLGALVASTDFNGGFGGIQAGYNWQISPNLVIGLESDSSWGSIKGTAPGLGPVGIEALGTVRGRLGYAIDRTLLYGTGGLAWANTNNIFVPDGYMIGWTAGAGIEYAFAERWSAKIEYLYADFGTTTDTLFGANIDERVTSHTVKVGLNYRASLLELLFQR